MLFKKIWEYVKVLGKLLAIILVVLALAVFALYVLSQYGRP